MNAVEERLAALRPILSAHAGGVELVSVTDGVVRLRYTGMCTGCHLRPATTAGTVRPALLAVEGVTAVQVEGSRISPQAEARLARAFAHARSQTFTGSSRGSRVASESRVDDELRRLFEDARSGSLTRAEFAARLDAIRPADDDPTAAGWPERRHEAIRAYDDLTDTIERHHAIERLARALGLEIT